MTETAEVDETDSSFPFGHWSGPDRLTRPNQPTRTPNPPDCALTAKQSQILASHFPSLVFHGAAALVQRRHDAATQVAVDSQLAAISNPLLDRRHFHGSSSLLQSRLQCSTADPGGYSKIRDGLLCSSHMK
ncbi:hypothetical protein PIB30_039145 [Stylosanthes scabra]|uniref:Uncharacterized protein n=1 Tax=Stylosanthes scabra TaxID=79078 RepID=A0ABU6UGX8_9FABA|nr:hypothetical protein [Stylosanthes scabra]